MIENYIPDAKVALLGCKLSLVLGGSGACSPRKFLIKNGVIWCIMSVPKLVIVNLKINGFFIINNTNFVPYLSPRSIRMRTLAQKLIHSHFTRGSGGKCPRSQRLVINGGFTFFTSNITYQARRYILLWCGFRFMLGVVRIFFIKMVQSSAF